MATIAMPHIGMGGHLGPASRLGGVLVRQGHRVIAWAPHRYRAQIEATGAEFRPQDPVRGPFHSLPGLAATMAEATERCAEGLINEFHSEQVGLVVHDVHVPWARVAGEFLGLPRIISNPLFPGSDLVVPMTSGPRVGRRDNSPTRTPASLAVHELEDAHDRVERCRLSIAGRWDVDIGDWSRTLINTAESTFSFTTSALTGRADLMTGWHYVGPLMPASPAPPAPREWPGQPEPLVYVAFGTAINTDPRPFRAAIEALAGLPVRVLVSTGLGRVTPESLAPLPANMTVRSYVESREVLARAALHITHGGCSSVHESLLAGVPMVCTPQASDQFLWSDRIQTLGAGRVVEITPVAIRAAAESLISDPTGRLRAAELGRHLAEFDGETRVSDVISHAL